MARALDDMRPVLDAFEKLAPIAFRSFASEAAALAWLEAARGSRA